MGDSSGPKFDPEADTRPDKGGICPHCEGDGDALVELPTGTHVRRICPVCWGKKRLTAEELLEYRKHQQSDEG